MKTHKFDLQMSPRIKRLYDNLIEKALGDRSEEWFTPEMFNDVIKYEDSEDAFPLWNNFENCSVIVRRAIAIDRMLEAMTDKKNNIKTHTADILPGDLLLGNMPMGSNGLGKVFPRFLTDDELSLADRNALLDLIRSNLMSVGYLSSVKVVGNTVTATCLGVDLTEVSRLVERLESDSRVSHVTVSTAQGKDDAGTSATIEVTLKDALDTEAGAAAGGAGAAASGTAAGEGAGNGAA